MAAFGSMDGLAEFELALAKEKSEREEASIKERESKHRHRHHRHYHRYHDDDGHESSHDSRSGKENRNKKEREKGKGRDGRNSRRENEGDVTDKVHHHRHSSRRDDLDDCDDHRSKRPRRLPDDTDKYSTGKHGEDEAESGSVGRTVAMPEQKEHTEEKPSLVRDSWMTAPSAIDIDYIHRHTKEDKVPKKSKTRHAVSSRELNSEALQQLNDGKAIEELNIAAERTLDYTIGDEGSQWRMTKLSGVYTVAEQTGRLVDEIAVERYGSLREFDDAREEKEELERKRLYGSGYSSKPKPTGELYRQRGLEGKTEADSNEGQPGQDADAQDGPQTTGINHTGVAVDQTTLNRMRAQLMKAKLQKSPDASKLEEAYNQSMSLASKLRDGGATAGKAVVLDATHNRMLAGPRGEVKAVDTSRGRKRGLVEANDDMSIDDMLREERRTRGQAGGEGLRLAERIAKDAKFDDDLDYLDENAEKLAKRVHKSEVNLKNVAVHEFTKMNKILESCPLCHHEDRHPPLDLPLAPIVSLATRVFLTLATEPELTGAEGGVVIVPVDHHTNLLECSDDEWEEIRNFMKSLTRLYHDQGRDVVFYENAATPQRRMHAALVAVPIPYELGDTAPAFFREAMLSADEEWSQHKKIIDTGKRAREGLGKLAFRRSIAKEMPYFHAWFTLDGGLGHIVEDASRWPRGDLFAREIVGGMLDVDPSIIKRQGRWTREDPRLNDFKRRWRKFDWTRVLTETA